MKAMQQFLRAVRQPAGDFNFVTVDRRCRPVHNISKGRYSHSRAYHANGTPSHDRGYHAIVYGRTPPKQNRTTTTIDRCQQFNLRIDRVSRTLRGAELGHAVQTSSAHSDEKCRFGDEANSDA
ncbi:hypothetical protein CIB48_g4867 [Xylaria polymorpha]|nr:hypothetical protein CIB48_g4867 [Xylaria polymorpha]